jgi:hypothetical protein
MSQRPVPTEPSVARRGINHDRYQFGILPLLALTTLVGAALAAIRLTHWPVSFRVVMAVYAIVMLTYITLRIPFLLKRLQGSAGEWQKIRRDRQELERLIDDHRRNRQAPSTTAQQTGEPDQSDRPA